MPQGRLFDHICNSTQFNEMVAGDFVRQILEAIQFLHNCRIAHLDIKVTYHIYKVLLPCYKKFET